MTKINNCQKEKDLKNKANQIKLTDKFRDNIDK